MNQLNSLILEGKLVRDAVLMEPVEGFKVCKFSLAVNRWHRNKNNEGIEEVSFFDVEVYGNYAEFCQAKGLKGRDVRVVGRLKQKVWKDENGKKQSKVFVIAEHLEFKPILTKRTETSAMENQAGVSVQLENNDVIF